MNKNVILTISGLHAMEASENGTVETVVPAEYFERNGSHYLLYEEKDEELQQTSKNRIKFREDYVELTRQGLVTTHMIFEKDKKHMTPYQTPFGQMLLGLDTKTLQIDVQEERIVIMVEYVLEADGEYLSDCRINLIVTNA